MRFLSSVFLFCITLSHVSYAQFYQEPESSVNKDLSHTFYLELGGSTVLASVNYELMNINGYAFRMGISPLAILFNSQDDDYYDEESRQESDLVAILAVSKIFGEGISHFESGAGFVFGQNYRDKNDDFPLANGFTPYVRYRMMSRSNENRYILRLTFTPIINSEGVQPWFGFSFGYSL